MPHSTVTDQIDDYLITKIEQLEAIIALQEKAINAAWELDSDSKIRGWDDFGIAAHAAHDMKNKIGI